MVIKLCAIYNVWSDWDLCKLSVNNIRPLVDAILIVCSHKSNYGEMDDGTVNFSSDSQFEHTSVPIYYLHREPVLANPMHEETARRNFGLSEARRLGYTHFIMLDADEMYDPEEFLREKQRFIDSPNLAGLVCRTQVYVKSPTLTIGYDTTLVPFIHKITPGLKHEFNRNYPFAWEGKNIRIDPTRSLNINSWVEWSDVTMHHYSWVRKDIEKKIRNSTARANLQRHKNLVQNFLRLKEGDEFELYPRKPLVRVPARFNIPDYGVVQDLQPSADSGTTSTTYRDV